MNILVIDPHHGKPSVGMIITEDMQVEKMWEVLDSATLFNALMQCPAGQAIIEGQYYSLNINTTIQLAAARGKMEGILDIYEIPYETVLPMRWKKYYNFKKYGKAYQRGVYKKTGKFLGTKCVDLIECYLMYLFYTKKLLADIPKKEE